MAKMKPMRKMRRFVRNIHSWWKRTRVVGIDANGNFVSQDRFGGPYITGKFPKRRPTLPIQIVSAKTEFVLPIHWATPASEIKS